MNLDPLACALLRVYSLLLSTSLGGGGLGFMYV